MIVNNLGFLFECRTDANNNTGVMGKYNVVYRGNTANLTLICAVDHSGKTVVPYRLNQSIGFEALNSFCENREDVAKFIKSNKPYFYKIGDFGMLGSGTLIFDKDTKKLISSENFNFYVPVTVSDSSEYFKDYRNNSQPALICEKLGTKNGLNIFKVQDTIANAYMETMIASFNDGFLDGREEYLCSLLLKG